MSEPKHGVGAVVAEASKGELVGTPAPENPGAAAQGALPLLEEIGGPDDAESPVGAIVAERRKAGRPVGAQNRLTKDIKRLILARHKHPLLALAEIASLPVGVLADNLKCKPLDALSLQVRVLAELSPYLAAKQAAVDDKGNTVLPVLQLNFGGERPPEFQAADGSGALSIIDAAKVAQDQWVSEARRGASHDDASHDEAQGVDDAGENGD